MIGRKPSRLEIVQAIGAALAVAGLLMLLPLGWVLLIVGLAALAVATAAEMLSKRTPVPARPRDGE